VKTSWNELAHRMPGREGELEDPDNIGNCAVDREANWLDKVGQLPELTNDYWKLMKAQHPNNLVAETTATYNGLQQKQKQLFDLVMNHYRRSLNQEAPNQILLHLDSQGGTGKTHVIMYLCQELDQLASQFEPGVGNRMDRRPGVL
jgi:Cdc6-like AAA superfamily ATPase